MEIWKTVEPGPRLCASRSNMVWKYVASFKQHHPSRSGRANFQAPMIFRETQQAMVKREANSNKKPVGLSILINFLLSWTLLPLVIPPFRIYSIGELIEALLWQGMGAVGWPLALIGGVANLLLHGKLTGLSSFLLIVIYPVTLLLLFFVLRSKHPRPWALILLHMLITFSFAAVWYPVLNGYEFKRD